ncbi:MAG: hypothetical protein EB003_12075 [Flavobacteriia bacterium]|nr:hypothetical protein [Flavobacteriia bacterium]
MATATTAIPPTINSTSPTEKELLNTKKGIQLAEDLYDCFTFFQKELQQVQSSSDITRYDEVYTLIKDLRGAFFEKIFSQQIN